MSEPVREPRDSRPDERPDDDVPGAGVRWVLSGEVLWLAGAGLVLLAAGAAGGRADVALIGLVPLACALAALGPRPRGEVWVDVVHEQRPSAAGVGVGLLRARVVLAAPPGTDGVRLRAERRGHRTVDALVEVPLTRTLDLSTESVRTGPQDLVRVDHQGLAAAGRVVGPPGASRAGSVVVLPVPGPTSGLPLPRRLRGLTGQHPSRRPGEGGDLRDVHPFQPGDDPRRVDWRVTARRAPRLEQVYVRRTLALAEAAVVLVLDSRDDVGPDPRTWSGMRPVHPRDATSLDRARNAAATLAQGYLGAGDRVAVEDLGVRRRALRPGAGRRQLDRVLQQLAVTRPEGAPPPRVRAPHLPAGAMVYLLSTFLDDEPVRLAQVWARSRHRVVAVDVLPRLRTTGLDERDRLAMRLVVLQREDRLAEVRAAGADVVRWSGDASSVLQHLARRSHRPGAGGPA